jgi:polysaccharide pyruvyl transferase WcaK-like protein
LWHGCQYSEWANPIWRDILYRLSKSGKPILNIGAGATYPWEKKPQTLIGDHDEDFVRLMLESCRLTTVRDTLAKKLFQSLDYDVDIICCPALLAGQVYASPTQPSRKVVINYMEGGGHYDWDQGIDKKVWQKTMVSVVNELTKHGWNVTLLAHDQKESELARTIWPNLACNLPQTPKEYFEFIKDAAFGIFNRMHASVAAAGLGIPSIAIGTDARNLMVAQIGLPVFYVKEASADVMLEATRQLMEQRQAVSARLLYLKEKTQMQYEVLLAPLCSSN